MRWMLAAVLLAGCTRSQAVCDPKVSCGGAAWTQLCNRGSAGCYYQTSDGSVFQCASCGDCANAKQFATAWCASPPGDLGAGGLCGQAIPCPGASGGSYQLCTDSTSTRCHYHASDGSDFACASCADCATGAAALSAWCQSAPAADLAVPVQPPADASTGDAASPNDASSPADLEPANCGALATDYACTECCYGQHPEGFTKIEALHACECTPCGAACAGSFVCGGTDKISTTCSSCLQTAQAAGGACSTQAQACRDDPDCAAIITCTSPCGAKS